MLQLNQFNYQILGNSQGPKLVFLHGLMGGAANWRKITQAFTDECHILIYDQRGHGRSFHPQKGYAPEDYAADLHFILQELGWNKIRLVGHSMGGRNALNFSFQWPELVQAVVLEDIGPDANPQAVSRIERLLALVPTPFASRTEAKKFLLNEFVEQIKDDPHAMTLAQYFYTNIEEKNGVADWRFSKDGILESLRAGRTKERWHELSGLKMPTLVVRGQDSSDLSHEIFLKMKAANPLVRGIEIPGAGHWVHYDQPQLFVETLQEFFTVL